MSRPLVYDARFPGTRHGRYQPRLAVWPAAAWRRAMRLVWPTTMCLIVVTSVLLALEVDRLMAR